MRKRFVYIIEVKALESAKDWRNMVNYNMKEAIDRSKPL
jgi:hypothetical protein